MNKRVGIKEAAEITGLSIWELRTGVNSGKYPHLRVGSSKGGRIIFDIELLEDRIKSLMLDNVNDDTSDYGKLRKVK